MKDKITDNSKIKTYIKAQKFYFLAEQCLNLIQKSIIPLLKEHGLYHSQYLILIVLRYAAMAKNEVISTEISYLLGLEKHSITSIVDSLCKKGYVKRERSEKDRRVVFLKLTPQGQRLVEMIQPQTMESIAVFPECSDSEFSDIIAFLENLRVLAASNNNQQPEIFKKAYEKLLLEGEEEFLKIYQKEQKKGN